MKIPLPYYNQCKWAYAFLITLVFLIGLYSLFLIRMFGYENMSQYDFLNKKVFSIPFLENCCSWWPLSHLFVFFILGFFFPNCGVAVIGAGILWEIIEMIISKILGRKRQAMRTNENIEYSGNWFSGSIKDIFFDVIGFVLDRELALQLQRHKKILQKGK